MPRTTEELVGGIIELDDDVSAEPFIEVANDLVTEFCTGDNGPTIPYSEGRLERIERWVAAHLYNIRVSKPTSEGVRGIIETFSIRKDLGLNNSEWGQMAMRIDSNGGLAAWNSAVEDGSAVKRFGLIWLGTEDPTDHLYYD